MGPIPLMRGMFVRVDLHCEPQEPLLVIPEEAVRPGKSVWIADNGQLSIQPIRIVRIENGMAYVDSRGSRVTAEDEIVSSPVPGAKAGLSVTTGAEKSANASREKAMQPEKQQTNSTFGGNRETDRNSLSGWPGSERGASEPPGFLRKLCLTPTDRQTQQSESSVVSSGSSSKERSA